MDIINDFLRNEYKVIPEMTSIYGGDCIDIRPSVTCNDGFNISIQASDYHYCEPRETFKPEEHKVYESVELGFPNMEDELIKEYAEDPDDLTGTVYPYTPVELVIKLIEKHGGIKN